MKKNSKTLYLLGLSSLIILSCEDKQAEEKLVVESFSITLVDKITTGDGSQSQPELVRFINSEKGVIVNSKQNTVDFINMNYILLILHLFKNMVLTN